MWSRSDYILGFRLHLLFGSYTLVYADQFVMVAGGYNAYESVELVSLDADRPVPECLLTIGSLPDGGRRNAAAGSLLPGRHS